MLEKEPTPANQQFVRRTLIGKVVKAKGALAQYDPRIYGGAYTRYRLTMASLKAIWPGIIADEVELGEEIGKLIQGFRDELVRMEKRMMEHARLSRARDDLLAKELGKLVQRRLQRRLRKK